MHRTHSAAVQKQRPKSLKDSRDPNSAWAVLIQSVNPHGPDACRKDCLAKIFLNASLLLLSLSQGSSGIQRFFTSHVFLGDIGILNQRSQVFLLPNIRKLFLSLSYYLSRCGYRPSLPLSLYLTIFWSPDRFPLYVSLFFAGAIATV